MEICRQLSYCLTVENPALVFISPFRFYSFGHYLMILLCHCSVIVLPDHLFHRTLYVAICNFLCIPVYYRKPLVLCIEIICSQRLSFEIKNVLIVFKDLLIPFFLYCL